MSSIDEASFAVERDVIRDCVADGSGCPGSIDDLATSNTSLTVSNCPVVAGVSLLLEIEHTFVNDLDIRLTHAGQSVAISSPACAGDNINAIYSETGNTEVCNEVTRTPGDQPQNTNTAVFGFFRPLDPLTAFVGGEGNGLWSLSVQDQAIGDTGTVVNWGLNLICTDQVENPL